MAHSYTDYLELLKIDPNVEMSLSDFVRFFQTDKDTVDAGIKAANDRIEAIAAQGYTANLPVNVADSIMRLRIENAATGYFNLPTLLASLPEHTPVRITGFVLSMSAQRDVDEFYDVLDRLYGLDASGRGLDKAQMNGLIDMGTKEITGDMIRAWKNRYPDIEITSTKITNKLVFFNFDGSEKFYEETVYLNNDSVWNPSSYTARTDHPKGYYYVFDGWSLTANTVVDSGTGARAGNPNLLKNVTESRILYAAYIRHPRTGPTYTVLQKATRMLEDTILNIDYWEDYVTAQYVRYNTSDGVKTDLGVSSSGDAPLGGTLLTIHMFSELFTGYNHEIVFSKADSTMVSVPVVLIDDRPSFHVLEYAPNAGDTALLKITTLGKFRTVTSLSYKESGSQTEYTVTSPSEIFNFNAAAKTCSIKMLSAAMVNGKYAINVEAANGETLRVPLPDLKSL